MPKGTLGIALHQESGWAAVNVTVLALPSLYRSPSIGRQKSGPADYAGPQNREFAVLNILRIGDRQFWPFPTCWLRRFAGRRLPKEFLRQLLDVLCVEIQPPGRATDRLQVRRTCGSAVVGGAVGAPGMHCFGRYSEQLGDFFGAEKMLAVNDLHSCPPIRLPHTVEG